MLFRYGELKVVDSPAPGPPVQNSTCGTVQENDSLELSCPADQLIEEVCTAAPVFHVNRCLD